jgi:hypothetical protein
MRWGILFIAIALIGCQRSSQPQTSLVGATKLPSAPELNKETLIIARMGGENWEDVLNIEIWPSDRIVAAHYQGQDRTTPIAREDLRMPTADIERVRRILWRLRPDEGAPAQRTVPVGCPYIYDAGFDWAVAYVRPDRPASLLQFTLPNPEDCKSSAYSEAKKIIGTAMRALPPSKVVEQFPAGRAQP